MVGLFVGTSNANIAGQKVAIVAIMLYVILILQSLIVTDNL